MKRHNSFAAMATSFALVALLAFCHGCGDSNNSDEQEMELLKKFQPFLVQMHAGDYDALPYPEESDRIGRLSLHAGDENYDYTVRVDTTVPVMYGDVHLATFGGTQLYQLVYAFFYPERPIEITPFEDLPEFFARYIWSGLIDGKVVRITLDADKEVPLLVEVVTNCGCDWQLYVNERVDHEARAEFAARFMPYPGLVKPLAPHDTQYVWIMPEDIAGEEARVVVVAEDGWCASTHHSLGAFTSYRQWFWSGPPAAEGILYTPEDFEGTIPYPAGGPTALRDEPYSLLSYDLLYELEVEGSGKSVGIFDELLYVWNSYSPYTKFLHDRELATKFPGTPKNKDHLEVVHETIDFWGADLFERFIHLPESLFGSSG